MNIVAKSDLNFQGIHLQPVENIDGTWLTASQIGYALQYADDKAVQRIYSRHVDEFTVQMTGVVKVTTPSGMQEARVFSLRGAHLIAMFARTPVAKEFRRWVLDILDREVEATSVENLPTEFHQRVMLYLDSKGGVIGSHPLTEDQVVMSFDGFVNFFRGKGWLVAPKEEVAKGLIGAIQSLP
ncbi:Bro-N domain-containing protein [Citrobacter freundii]|nr:Bro-N domain-containing protein [Citrobacter freundii]QMM94962.1 Bro-N domain-containing protein [Citrobacter freundii]